MILQLQNCLEFILAEFCLMKISQLGFNWTSLCWTDQTWSTVQVFGTAMACWIRNDPRSNTQNRNSRRMKVRHFGCLATQHTQSKALMASETLSLSRKRSFQQSFLKSKKQNIQRCLKKPPGTFLQGLLSIIFFPKCPTSSVHVIQRHRLFQILRSRPWSPTPE